MIPAEQIELVGHDQISMCSFSTLRRVRRKLGSGDGDGPTFIRLISSRRKAQGGGDDHGKSTNDTEKTGSRGSEVAAEQKGDDGLESWLIAWDEIPEGCVALLGRADEAWQTWGIVR